MECILILSLEIVYYIIRLDSLITRYIIYILLKKKRKEILVFIHIDLNILKNNMILLCSEDVDIKIQWLFGKEVDFDDFWIYYKNQHFKQYSIRIIIFYS